MRPIHWKKTVLWAVSGKEVFCGNSSPKRTVMWTQFSKKNCYVDTVLQKELLCGHSSPKRTVRRIWFSKKNCWEDMVLEKELLCGHSSQKRTMYWVQFLEKIRFKKLRAVVGLDSTCWARTNNDIIICDTFRICLWKISFPSFDNCCCFSDNWHSSLLNHICCRHNFRVRENF